MRLHLEHLRHFIPSRVMLIGFACLVLALVGSCSILEDAPREYVSTTTITPMIEREAQRSKLVIIGQEQVEVVDLETQNIRSMPFAELYLHEIDLRQDRGISSTGMIAARVLGADGKLEKLSLQIVNPEDGTSLATIPLFSESLTKTLFNETNPPLDTDVVNMLLGGWAAPRRAGHPMAACWPLWLRAMAIRAMYTFIIWKMAVLSISRMNPSKQMLLAGHPIHPP